MNLRLALIAATVAFLALVAPTLAATNLIVNGSFETGPDPGRYLTLRGGSQAIPGWTVLGTSVDYVGTNWQAATGSRSIDLDGTPGPGGMAQTFMTTPGKRYRVRFALAGNPQCAPTIKRVRVSGGNSISTYDFDVRDHTWSDMGWAMQDFDFMAIQSKTRLEFMSIDPPGNCGPTLDAVSAQSL